MLDKLLQKILGRYFPLYKKYKMPLLYIFFGAVTTIVNWGVYFVCIVPLNMSMEVANAIAWVVAVLVAFVTNKLFVFESKSTEKLLPEFMKFIPARLLSLGIEYLVLLLGVRVIGIDELIVKIPATVLVLVLNYIASKWFIFAKKEDSQ